jgi:RNA recognition motif-containing protein
VHKGQGRGYAFVTVSSEDEQKKTIDTLNGKEITVTITPRAPKEGGGVTETENKEGGEAPLEKKEKVLRLQARQGYENEQNEKENDGE